MGTIIGRGGLKIKHIQDNSGVRMVAQKEMLPQSTERVVELQGTPEGIQRAVWEICKCLVDDWQRGTGTVLYNPVVRTQTGGSGSLGGNNGNERYGQQERREYGNSSRVMRTGNGADFSNGAPRQYNRRSDSDAASRGPPTHDENGDELQTQNISIPADMVGCIIGRGGSKISEIRKSSGARISIAKVSKHLNCSDSLTWLHRLTTVQSRLLMMRLARECSPLLVQPRPMSLPSSSSTRTSRLRRCAARNRLLRHRSSFPMRVLAAPGSDTPMEVFKIERKGGIHYDCPMQLLFCGGMIDQTVYNITSTLWEIMLQVGSGDAPACFTGHIQI